MTDGKVCRIVALVNTTSIWEHNSNSVVQMTSVSEEN